MRQDVPPLRTERIVSEVQKTFARGCSRPGFRLVHYALQDDRAHFIVEAQDPDALGRGMIAIGARLARAVNRVTGRSGRVFADRYRVRMLESPRAVHAALRSVLLNAPAPESAATVTDDVAARAVSKRWRAPVAPAVASSARWFDGWKGKLEREGGPQEAAAGEAIPVARPRTWLLRKGWRQHGLLDPSEVPK